MYPGLNTNQPLPWPLNSSNCTHQLLVNITWQWHIWLGNGRVWPWHKLWIKDTYWTQCKLNNESTCFFFLTVNFIATQRRKQGNIPIKRAYRKTQNYKRDLLNTIRHQENAPTLTRLSFVSLASLDTWLKLNLREAEICWISSTKSATLQGHLAWPEPANPIG